MAKLINFMDSALTDLKEKGNLDYAQYLYNPKNFFEKVIHFSLYREDKSINLGNNIEIKILKKPKRLIFWPLIFLFNIFYIIYIIKKEKISIIRGRSPYLGSLWGLIASKITKIPIVVSLGGNNRLVQERNKSYYFRNKFISYKIEEIVLKNANIILVPNEYTDKYVESITKGKIKGKFVKIAWILKKDIFNKNYKEVDIYKIFNLEKRYPLITNIGFLSKYKYVDKLIPVIDRLLKENYRFQLVFCGDGPLKETIKKKYSPFIGSVIFILGWQNQNIVANLLKNSSVAWILMSGFALLEAAASGAPIITSGKEWHNEFINDGINGYIINPDNENEIFEKTVYLLKNKSLQEKFKVNARKKLEKEYDPIDLLNEEIGVYKELIK